MTQALAYYPGLGTLTVNYVWDVKNQLVAVDAPGYFRSEFSSDGLGRRVRIIEKNAAGAITADRPFIWDGLRIAQEHHLALGVPTKIYHSQGEIRGSVKYYYTKDHLGNLREVLNNTGGLVARYNYDAFGVPTQTVGTMQFDKLYTGHFYHQPSGLHLAPYRAYNPQMGRWISREPLGLDGPNLYHYVFNNPLSKVDTTGLETEVLTHNPAGYGRSSLGHTAIRINAEVFSYGHKGWTIQPAKDYMSNNSFRGTYGQLLKLTPEEEKSLYGDFYLYVGDDFSKYAVFRPLCCLWLLVNGIVYEN